MVKEYKFWIFGLFAECKLYKCFARSYKEAEEIVQDFLSKTNMYHNYQFFTVVD